MGSRILVFYGPYRFIDKTLTILQEATFRKHLLRNSWVDNRFFLSEQMTEKKADSKIMQLIINSY